MHCKTSSARISAGLFLVQLQFGAKKSILIQYFILFYHLFIEIQPVFDHAVPWIWLVKMGFNDHFLRPIFTGSVCIHFCRHHWPARSNAWWIPALSSPISHGLVMCRSCSKLLLHFIQKKTSWSSSSSVSGPSVDAVRLTAQELNGYKRKAHTPGLGRSAWTWPRCLQ